MDSSSAVNLRYLKYVLLPGRCENGIRGSRLYYNAAYTLWKSVWSETLRELDSLSALYSDDFTRQDEIGAIFDGTQCLMLSFFRLTNLRVGADREDSYFKVWPEEALRQLTKDGNRVLVGSTITIAPSFRGSKIGVSAKDLLMGLLIKRFLDTPADAMTGTMRNNRGMNECAFRHGGLPIKSNLTHHGVAVDLVGFYRSSVRPCEVDGIAPLVEFIWNNRVQLSKNPWDKNQSEFRLKEAT